MSVINRENPSESEQKPDSNDRTAKSVDDETHVLQEVRTYDRQNLIQLTHTTLRFLTINLSTS